MGKKKGSIRKSIRINGVLHQETFPTRALANEWYSKMAALQVRVRTGLEIPFEPIKIEIAIANSLVAREKTIATWRHDKARFERYVLPAFMGRDLHAITRKEWQTFFNDLVEVHGLSAKTANNIRTLLHKLYKDALVDEPPRALNNPISAINAKAVPEVEIEYFSTPDQCARYLEAATHESASFYLWAMFALNTGGRETEIAVLDYSDINFETHSVLYWKIFDKADSQVKKRTKSKKQRRVALNDSLMNAIAAHRSSSRFRGPADYVMTSSTGRHLDPKTIWETHGRVIERAGLHYVSPHALRHTFATQYLEHGGSIYDLKNILGHSTIKMTEKYLHVVQSRSKEKAAVFEISAPKQKREVIELRPARDAAGPTDAPVMQHQHGAQGVSS